MKCAKRISLAVLFSCCVFSFAQTTTPSEAVPEASPKATASYGPLEVLTDTMGVDFGPYLKRVLEDVKVNWYNLVPKSAKAPPMKKGKLTIEFAILKDGTIGGMRLAATSGDVALDRAAWGGITASNPFLPLPYEFLGDYLGLRFTFWYNPDKADLAGTSTNPPMLDNSSIGLRNRAYDAMKAGNYNLAIDLLNRVVEADPKSDGAWNSLGLAYLDSRQNDLAIRSFQKQIEVNPYHEYAYNNLGRVYLRERKYEEAIKWFRKQIEINPLDKYAHSNLGIAYLEQRKYAEALPELEKAASLTPDNAESQVRLGTAYLNLGQDEKAMAAFDKALKISTKPLVWNNIAYQLTLKKAHPDIARHYAEYAVATTAAELRNFSFDQLSPQNIGTTSSLAAYWDTLGWVEFTDGDLDEAEKYLLAAWQLGQRSDVADHLGQLCEKRNEKDRALHFYKLSMSARRPEPETRSRLSALAGGNDKVDTIVENSREELSAERTIKVGNASKQEGKADFFVLLTSGKGSQAFVDDVKFVSGDEKLKVSTDALRVAQYGQTVPDETGVKLLRRGTLSCIAVADCTLLLALPEDVKSVN